MKIYVILILTMLLASQFAYATEEPTPNAPAAEKGKEAPYDVSIILGTVTEDDAIAGSTERVKRSSSWLKK